MGIILGSTLLLMLPASIAVLGTSGRAIDAFDPRALWHMLQGLGVCYFLVLAVITALSTIAVLLWHAPMWSPLRYAFLELSVLAAFSAIGGAVYLRRGALEFEPRTSPERVQELAESSRHRERQRMLDELFQLVNSRQSRRAAKLLQAWFAPSDPTAFAEDAHTVVQAALTWHNEWGTTLVLRGLFELLIAAVKPGVAMDSLRSVLANYPDFTLDSEPGTLALARWANASGQPRLALQILHRFEQHFPDRPLSEAARQLRLSLAHR